MSDREKLKMVTQVLDTTMNGLERVLWDTLQGKAQRIFAKQVGQAPLETFFKIHK